MTDAINALKQDKKLVEQSEKIIGLEKIFKNEPSVKLAKDIIEEINNYMNMHSGYWKSPNHTNAINIRENYEKYLKENQ